MLAGLGLSVLFHIYRTCLAVYALDLNIGFQTRLLHLEEYKASGQ